MRSDFIPDFQTKKKPIAAISLLRFRFARVTFPFSSYPFDDGSFSCPFKNPTPKHRKEYNSERILLDGVFSDLAKKKNLTRYCYYTRTRYIDIYSDTEKHKHTHTDTHNCAGREMRKGSRTKRIEILHCVYFVLDDYSSMFVNMIAANQWHFILLNTKLSMMRRGKEK